MTPREEELYRRALDYATQKHSGQLRIGGAPYITHPVAVARLVREHGYGLDYQIAALFHDLLEDTDATAAELAALSSDEVAQAVVLLTKQKGYDMQKYVGDICKNPMAKAVKAADRLHNLQCALVANQEFKRRYILETLDWYMDFLPEIPAAVKALAQSLEQPMTELSLLYEPIEKWNAEGAGPAV
ncbi:MAG: HD domain-containing protein [Oscillospiraceae bacterium]